MHPQDKFSTWLYRIAYNESLKRLKIRSRKDDIGLANDLFYYIDFPMEDDEDYLQLHQSIEMLREKEKSVIMLHYLSEKPINEIVKITGLTKSNIKILLHRGRLNLKKILTK